MSLDKCRNTVFNITASLLSLVFFLFLSGISQASYASSKSLFVIPNGSGACSKTDPGDLRTALSLAIDGDTIYLAQGTYTGTGDAVIIVTKSITIRGGWDRGTTMQPVCDPIAHPSTIDGQGERRGVYISGDIAPVIQGLRITGGNAEGLGGYEYPEGYIYDAGGGVYVITATATLKDNRIFGNIGPEGAGVFLGGSSSTLDHNEIFNNTAAGTGGGVFVFRGTPTLIGNTIYSNITQSRGGGGGGGVYIFSSTANLLNNTISGNHSASHGGGVTVASCSPLLTGNLVIDNVAGWEGGGINLWYSHSSLVNNVIADNRVTAGEGSGLWIGGSKLSLAHTTIAHNTGGDGSGIYVADAGSTHSSVTMTNTILAGQEIGIGVAAGSSATLEATLWGSGIWANGTDWRDDGDVVTGSINIWGDPSFVDPDSGDYHIGPESAAIDAGVDAGATVDIDGDSRPIGPAFDIGADEASN